MSPDRSDTFFQRYVVRDAEVTVYWGTLAGAMVFVVFDPTNGLSRHATFRIQAGPNGNIGILTTPSGDAELCAGGVAEIHDDHVDCDTLALTDLQLTEYLESSDYDLDLSGIRAFSQA
ncbi:MAG: hypothetical protein ABJZ55_13320 [Fuerstiella sp.]